MSVLQQTTKCLVCQGGWLIMISCFVGVLERILSLYTIISLSETFYLVWGVSPSLNTWDMILNDYFYKKFQLSIVIFFIYW